MTDATGKPIHFSMSAGQISDNSGAVPWDNKPQADWLLANCGYDADWLKNFLARK
ncbi:hypothetical protein [Paracoccus sediminilitoris]|uniref:hypothetical protein n=1 Tax=Paracoccus sediminilitoris TaxID=2202419 RepID=UPI0013147B21|nr:hypothetical protein [Paracoccus sediminilitoris]